MDHQKRLAKGTLRVAEWAIVALFLIPALTYGHSTLILNEWDQNFANAVYQKVPKERMAEAQAYVEHAKPSAICFATDPNLAKSRETACSLFSNIWQASMAQRGSIATLIGGGVLLALALAFSAAAFGRRSVQYASFVTGKQVMILASVAEIILQGLMLVWLSFWVTAFFFHVYYVKLIAIAAIAVGFAALAAIVGIFSRAAPSNTQHGELISEADAPHLWAHIRQMAARLETAPPKQIVAGIDANFYVTEAPLTVGSQILNGRTLYVSLPLLRKLETGEADAVLAHELAHLSGGDTANGARLGPAVMHYDKYCRAMREGGATIVAWPLLAFYRIIFELALARSRREREFRADRIAAELVSPQGISRALVKTAAYSIYRSKVEEQLFKRRSQHTGGLGIAAQINSGLATFVQSPAFMDQISKVQVPHPFDSHPPLNERMSAVGAVLAPEHYADVAAEMPASSWASDIIPADAIEDRLWNVHDGAFAAKHERSLAYRYEPANEAEEALVLKYFPTRDFALRKNAVIQVSYAGIRSSASDLTIPWGVVTNLNYKSSSFGDRLVVSTISNGVKSTHNVKLPKIGAAKGELQAVLGAYWHRHQVMKHMQTA